MILGYHTHYTDLIRTYTSLSGMTSDGFAVTDPEYIAASVLQAQSPPVNTWMIGRRTSVPTQIVNCTPTKSTGIAYSVTLGVANPGKTAIVSQTFSYTALASDTASSIVGALVTAIGANVTGVTPSNSTGVLVLTGTAGIWFEWAVSDNSGNANGMGLWSVQDVSADAGVTSDITNVNAANSAWYAFCTTHQNYAEGVSLATWAESNNHFFAIDVADTAAKDSAYSSVTTTDLLSKVCAQSRARTAASYHQIPSEFLSVAWIGTFLSYQPGTYTAKFKTLSGVTPDVLTDTEVGYILGTFNTSTGAFTGGKNGNCYQTLAGVSIMSEGWDASGEYIDKLIYVDSLVSGIQTDEYAVFVANAKVPFTDAGVAQLEAPLRARLNAGVKLGALASFTVSAPAVSTVPAANRSARNYPYLTFVATIAGAIHDLQVTGQILGS